jgi:predicted ATPase
MRIRSVHISSFKRFTQLVIPQLPESARLVVLIGPNGSGKSSLFEAFNFWISPFRGMQYDSSYHWKVGIPNESNWDQLHSRIAIQFHGQQINPRARSTRAQKAFYIRSAYRHEADFSNNAIAGVADVLEDQKRPAMLISADARVSDNYQRLVFNALLALFDRNNDNTRAKELRERLIGKIQDAMSRVFGDLTLSSPGRPMIDGTFLFEKGISRDFRYKNLSAGEKAAFDLLLDFVVKTESFDDTVFCIDEPELHTHTKLQAKLLDELFRRTPETCQLWIATHSIGMTRRAMELHQQRPGEVVFLDFEDQDFDTPVVLEPATVDRQFWRKVFRVALDDLSELVAPSQVVLCEGRPEGYPGERRTTTFDADIYRRIFRSTHPEAEFVPLGGTNELSANGPIIRNVLARMFTTMRIWSLLDRDDRSPEEVENLASRDIRVLHRRDLESYLWDDEILQKLCASSGKPGEAGSLIAKKAALVAALPSRSLPADDVKAIAGALYVETKKVLALTQHGNTAEEFAKTALAPLITPETAVYLELDECVFGGERQRRVAVTGTRV